MIEYTKTPPAIARISDETAPKYPDLFEEYGKARHGIFVEEKKWFPPSTTGVEFDQYDTDAAQHLVFFIDGDVAAGMRFLPTTAENGDYSYMIRDAKLGLLPTLPTSIMREEAPVSDVVWECTRVFVTTPFRKRFSLGREMARVMVVTAKELGIETLLVLTWEKWEPLFRRTSIYARPLGEMFITSEGERSQCVAIDVRASALT